MFRCDVALGKRGPGRMAGKPHLLQRAKENPQFFAHSPPRPGKFLPQTAPS